MSFQACRSGRVVKGQYAGCIASGQPLTRAPRKDPFPRVVAFVLPLLPPGEGRDKVSIVFFEFEKLALLLALASESGQVNMLLTMYCT